MPYWLCKINILLYILLVGCVYGSIDGPHIRREKKVPFHDRQNNVHSRTRRETSDIGASSANGFIYQCNTNTSYQCGCGSCVDRMLDGSPCCGDNIEQVHLRDAVKIEISDISREQFNSTIEIQLKGALSGALTRFCSGRKKTCWNDSTSILDPLTFQPEQVVLFKVMGGNPPSQQLNISFIVYHPYPQSTRARRNAFSIDFSALINLRRDSFQRQTRSAQTVQTINGGIIIQALEDQSSFILSYLGMPVVVVRNHTPKHQPESVGCHSNSCLAGVICGAIFGALFLTTCVISAVKAVR